MEPTLESLVGFRAWSKWLVRRELAKYAGREVWASPGGEISYKTIQIKRNAEDTIELYGKTVPSNAVVAYMSDKYSVDVHYVGGSRSNWIYFYFKEEIQGKKRKPFWKFW